MNDLNSEKNGWLAITLFCVVIALHSLAIYAILSTRTPQLQIASMSTSDSTEGASVNELLEIVAIEDFVPEVSQQPPEPPKETFSVTATEPEQADLVEPPIENTTEQVVEKPIEPVQAVTKPQKIENTKEEPQKITKTPRQPEKTVKTKPKKEVKPSQQKPQEGNSNQTVKGESGSSRLARGKQGEGVASETSASHRGSYLHNPKPPYPAVSIEKEEEGTVTLRAIVEPNGRPSKVEIVHSSGYRRLDQAALKVVTEKYQFIPATRLGKPVQSSYVFNIQFSLTDR